jgi:hypothetical protein
MTGLTDFITQARWEDVWLIWFVKVVEPLGSAHNGAPSRLVLMYWRYVDRNTLMSGSGSLSSVVIGS